MFNFLFNFFAYRKCVICRKRDAEVKNLTYRYEDEGYDVYTRVSDYHISCVYDAICNSRDVRKTKVALRVVQDIQRIKASAQQARERQREI